MRVMMTSTGDEISRSIALTLVDHGSTLVLLGEELSLKRFAEEITHLLNLSTRVEVIGLDMLGDKEAVFDSAVDKAFKHLGFVNAFINCYSYEGKMQEAINVDEDEFKRIMKVNFSAVWFLVKAVSRRMRDLGIGGSIVLLTSVIGGGRGLYPGAAAYASCLAGVEQLVRTWALEVGKYKIRVNAIARGLHLSDEFPTFIGKERADKLTKDVMPLLRWLDVEKDLASTFLYLVGDESRYMTGTTIIVDGAQSLVRPRLRSFM